MNVWTGLL